jgi:ComEC/Rec2-related protein
MVAALYFWSLQGPLPPAAFVGKVSFVKGRSLELESAFGKGRIWLELHERDPRLGVGDVVLVQGQWHRPRKNLYNLSRGLDFEGKAVKKNLIAQGGNPKDIKSQAKRVLSDSDWGPLHGALLLGAREGLPQGIGQLFRKSGTAHLLAVSGLHFGIVLYFVILGVSFMPVPGRWRVFLWLLGALGYALLLSDAPSALRALVFVWVLGLAKILGRRVKILDMLWNAGGFCLLLWPSLLFQAGFVMSFLATALIVWSIPYWERITHGFSGVFRKLILALGIGLTAQTALLGLLFYFFKEVNFLGIFITVPLSLLLFLELGWLLLGLGLEALIAGGGRAFFDAADMAASGIMGILAQTGKIGWLIFQGDWGFLALLFFYLLLGMGIYVCERIWGGNPCYFPS